MSQPQEPLPGEADQKAANPAQRRLRSPTKRPAMAAVGGLCRVASSMSVKENQRLAAAPVQAKRLRPGGPIPVPLGKSRRNIAGSACNVPSAAASTGARPKATASGAVGGSTAALAPSAPNKRKPWDLQGRIRDLEERMQGLSGEKEQLSQQSSVRLQEVEKLSAALQAEQQRTRQQAATIAELEQDLSLWKSKEQAASTELGASKLQVATLQHSVTALDHSLAEATGALAGLRSERAALLSVQESLESQRSTLTAEKERLESALAACQARLAEQQEQLDAGELERRQLHNTLQELKGNIRVFCRLRPLLPSERPPQQPFLALPDQRTVEVLRTDLETQRQTSQEFSFDRVFPSGASQAEVYTEVSQLVQSALDGYHVCIFAYGQTGAGKTHTMEGPPGELALEDDQRGLIPRALHQVFQVAHSQPHWTYTMVASFVEVYNETLRDLLATQQPQQQQASLQLKMAHKDGPVTVAGLTEVPVTSAEQITQLLRRARKNRAVAATKCNERSSRSHSVFRLDIVGQNTHTGLGCRGRLNLVDLAGSERLSESQSEGARLREAQNINKSLANLGNVILALSNRADHVPYRNSKLTHLLMDSLGGNSKTLMLLSISPREENIGETINSLRFATKVNQCHIGTARKNI
ncbi:kinesin-like protein KIFC1 isoform X2 [Haemaphysalis longicornis]